MSPSSQAAARVPRLEPPANWSAVDSRPGTVSRTGAAVALLLAFLSLVAPSMAGAALPEAAVAITALGVVGLSTAALARDHFALYLLYWLALVLFQNLFAGAFDLQGEAPVPLVVTEAKTISAVIAAVVNAPSIVALFRRFPSLFLATAIYLVLVAANVGQLTTPAIAYGRNFLFPVIFLVLLAAKAREMTRIDRLRLLQFLLYFSSFVLGAGAVLEWLLSTELWRDSLNASQNGTLNSLATNTTILGVEFQRFGGFLIEPINQGYLAASVVVALVLLALARPSVTSQPLFWFAVISAGLALVMSVAKNGALMFALAAVALVLTRYVRRSWVAISLTALAGFIATMFYASTIQGADYLVRAFTDPLGAVGGDSSTFHVAGLITGVSASFANFPLGAGLGQGGNFSRIERGETGLRFYEGWLDTGAESAWGVVAYQIGLPALVVFVLILVLLGERLGRFATVLLAVWFAAATYSEAFTGPISSSILLMSAVLLGDSEFGPHPAVSQMGARNSGLGAHLQ